MEIVGRERVGVGVDVSGGEGRKKER